MNGSNLYWIIGYSIVFVVFIYSLVDGIIIRSKICKQLSILDGHPTVDKQKNVVKEYKELHQQGILSVETHMDSKSDCDCGIMIAKDGRIWICIDGIAFIRFKPIK